MRYFKHKNKFFPVNGKDIDHIGLTNSTITYFFSGGTSFIEESKDWTLKSADNFVEQGFWIEIYPDFPKYYVKSEGSWAKTAYIIEYNKKDCTLVHYNGEEVHTCGSFSRLYGDWAANGFIKQVSKEEAEKLLMKKPIDTKPTVLSPIDPSSIEVGMNLTALSRKNMEDRSYRGDALEVKSVCLPFIVIQTKYGPTSLDTRDWNLAQLPQDYVDALKKG